MDSKASQRSSKYSITRLMVCTIPFWSKKTNHCLSLLTIKCLDERRRSTEENNAPFWRRKSDEQQSQENLQSTRRKMSDNQSPDKQPSPRTASGDLGKVNNMIIFAVVLVSKKLCSLTL